MANDVNKNGFIQLLMNELDEAGMPTSQSYGDADIDIAVSALTLASRKVKSIAVVADDTDILVLLVHHFKPEHSDIYFLSKATKKGKNVDYVPATIRDIRSNIEVYKHHNSY